MARPAAGVLPGRGVILLQVPCLCYVVVCVLYTSLYADPTNECLLHPFFLSFLLSVVPLQKYRFYFQEYDATRHVIVHPRTVWAIGAFIGEYDVPQCAPGTPAEQCSHEIWGVVKAGGDNLHIAAAHFHCHAPTCLAMEIWNNATGELICRQRPVYGGTGKIAEHKFDEPGYIATPPCLWGDAPGLAPMPLASGVEFTIRAITNNTYGHHGEMAFPEIALVPWNTTSNTSQPGVMPKGAVQTEWRLLSFSG